MNRPRVVYFPSGRLVYFPSGARTSRHHEVAAQFKASAQMKCVNSQMQWAVAPSAILLIASASHNHVFRRFCRGHIR